MLTQTSAGWTFTQGRETFGPYPTRDAAAEALYDLQRGQHPEQIIIDAIDRATRADDPHSIPSTVGAIVLPPFARCCARIEALGLPDALLDVALSAVAELADHLTSSATVKALYRAWAVGRHEVRYPTERERLIAFAQTAEAYAADCRRQAEQAP